MKRKLLAVLLIATVLVALLFPFGSYYVADGGTRIYGALVYKYVDWQAGAEGNSPTLIGKRVYLFPRSLQSYDALLAYEMGRQMPDDLQPSNRTTKEDTIMPQDTSHDSPALAAYLRAQITAETDLAQAVDIFAQMAKLPLDTPDADELLLYEAGNFDGTFTVSLVRQFRGSETDDEFVQLHLELSFASDKALQNCDDAIWSDAGDFWAQVRTCESYRAITEQHLRPLQIDIWQ